MNYPWGHQKRYNNYSGYTKVKYKNRVQKISVNLGLSCPNRDGEKGTGGCIYCNNNTFSPFYCKPDKDIRQQLEEGIAFFKEKYNAQQYFAYFQSYTNTYANNNFLIESYKKALEVENVIGIIIATRPDCLNEELLKQLQIINKEFEVIIEFGIESTSDRTLKLVNRCHTWQDSTNAIYLTNKYGINIGAHMIIGLPGENEDDIISHANKLSRLPINTLKIHQLQIIKGTKAEMMFNNQPNLFSIYTVDSYIELLIRFLEKLNPDIIIERFISESPREMLISPIWGGLKNFEFVAKIEKRLEELNTWQGRYFK